MAKMALKYLKQRFLLIKGFLKGSLNSFEHSLLFKKALNEIPSEMEALCCRVIHSTSMCVQPFSARFYFNIQLVTNNEFIKVLLLPQYSTKYIKVHFITISVQYYHCITQHIITTL